MCAVQYRPWYAVVRCPWAARLSLLISAAQRSKNACGAWRSAGMSVDWKLKRDQLARNRAAVPARGTGADDHLGGSHCWLILNPGPVSRYALVHVFIVAAHGWQRLCCKHRLAECKTRLDLGWRWRWRWQLQDASSVQPPGESVAGKVAYNCQAQLHLGIWVREPVVYG